MAEAGRAVAKDVVVEEYPLKEFPWRSESESFS
jgi:hypothetical protein